MSINLKIEIKEQNNTKIMRFAEQMSIYEVCKSIQEKIGIGGKDHGIFLPSGEREPDTLGKWLKPEKSIEFYDLKQNDLVEYRKRHEVIKVKLVDETIKAIMIDLSIPVSEVVQVIGNKISVRNADEFSLQAEQKAGVWLKSQLSIPEQVSTLDQIFLLKKKFFVNDANVDQDDPVQLHLVYCQSRDDIVSGKHPVNKDEAVLFASLQAQIQYGDFKPDVHKPGFISLAEILPPQHQKKDIERNFLSEWKKLVGMNEVNARFRYVQLCRSLKTYGMTVFQVKEKVQGKKKLMDALLCFTRDSIVRMELETNKIIKEHPFKHLLRWAASPETFTLDFGTYEEEYIVVVTTEGEAISALISGYIDLLLKKQKDTGVVIEDDDAEVAEVSSVAKVGGHAMSSTASSTAGSSALSASQSVSDCSSGAKAIEKMMAEMFGEIASVVDTNLTPAQRRHQIELQAKQLAALSETMENLAKAAERSGMNTTAHKISAICEQLIVAARHAAASGADPNQYILDATKGVSEALKNLLIAAQESANKPNDPQALEALARAQQVAQANLQKLAAASRGIYADDGFQMLFRELARAMAAESKDLVLTGQEAESSIQDPLKKQQLQAASASLLATQSHFQNISDILAPTVHDDQCKITVTKSAKAVEQNAAFLVATAKASVTDPRLQQALMESHRRINNALQNLLAVTELPDMSGAKDAEEFTEAAHNILQSAASVMAAQGNPEIIKQQSANLKNAATALGASGKAIISQQSDLKQKERLANYLKGVVEATKKLLCAVPAAIADPNDTNSQKKLYEACQEVTEATHQLIGDTGRQVAIAALYNSAKLAAAATTKLCSSSHSASASVVDNQARQQLSDATRAASEAVQKFIGVLRFVTEGATPSPRRQTSFMRRASMSVNIKDDIMQGAEQFAPVAYKLVSTAKSTSSKVTDPELNKDMVFASNDAAKAIHKMLSNRKAMKAVKGQLETAEAIEEFKAAQAELESALISVETGILQKTKSKDDAMNDLAIAIQDIGNNTKQMAITARSSPEELGTVMKRCAASSQQAVVAASALAANIEDRVLQKEILSALKAVLHGVKNMMQVAKAVGSNPEDANLNNLMLTSGKQVAEALVRLTDASKGIVPRNVEEFQAKSSNEIEDLAEKELQGAAAVIEKCVAKLNAAAEAARQRASEKDIDIDEQNITEAIMEAAQAIAKTTVVLVNAATVVQQEFQKLMKEPRTANVYKRDPQWAQGLISAARTVAGAVQHLVKAANAAAQGSASEEALIVAAQAVSAATAQLVTASTVKADPNSQSQIRLRDASSKVGQATSQLVNAAKAAANWEKEQKEIEEEEKYSLAENKIREMEQQMQILRLEKQLEMARSQLGTMRKMDYVQNVNLDSDATKASASTKAQAFPQTSKVPWKQNIMSSNLNGTASGNPNRTGPAPVSRGPSSGPPSGPAPVSRGPSSGPLSGSAPSSRGPPPGPPSGPAPVSRGPSSGPPSGPAPVSRGPSSGPPSGPAPVSRGPPSGPPSGPAPVSRGPPSGPSPVSRGPPSGPSPVSRGPPSGPAPVSRGPPSGPSPMSPGTGAPPGSGPNPNRLPVTRSSSALLQPNNRAPPVQNNRTQTQEY